MTHKLITAEAAGFSIASEAQAAQIRALRQSNALQEVRTRLAKRLQLRRDIAAGVVFFVAVFSIALAVL